MRRRFAAVGVSATALTAVVATTIVLTAGTAPARGAASLTTTSPNGTHEPWIVTQAEADQGPFAARSQVTEEPPEPVTALPATDSFVTSARAMFHIAVGAKAVAERDPHLNATTVAFTAPAGYSMVVTVQSPLPTPVPVDGLVDTTSGPYLYVTDSSGNAVAESDGFGSLDIAIATASGRFIRVERDGPGVSSLSVASVFAEVESFAGIDPNLPVLREVLQK